MRVPTVKLLGVGLFLLGLILLALSWGTACDGTLETCTDDLSYYLLYLGWILIAIFCCCPAFNLGESQKLFYDAFPYLKKPIQMALHRRNRGTQDVHAASIV